MNRVGWDNPTQRVRSETDTGKNFAQHCGKVQALEYFSDHLGTYKDGKKLKQQLFRTLRHIRRSIWQGRVARNKTRELLKKLSALSFLQSDIGERSFFMKTKLADRPVTPLILRLPSISARLIGNPRLTRFD